MLPLISDLLLVLGLGGRLDVFPPMIPGEFGGGIPFPPLWDGPQVFTGIDQPFIFPVAPVPQVMVAGPSFVGTLMQPFCIKTPAVHPVPYNFRFFNEPVWPSINKGVHRPTQLPLGNQRQGQGQIIPWWSATWGVGNQQFGDINMIPQPDWNFARQWGTQGPTPGNTWPMNTGEVVPQQKTMDVNPVPQVPPAVQVQVNTNKQIINVP